MVTTQFYQMLAQAFRPEELELLTNPTNSRSLGSFSAPFYSVQALINVEI